jgi:16S rRNA (uracil1498-N3)-methyltransferase
VYLAGSGALTPTGEVELREEQAWHLARVLRARPGESIRVVVDGTQELLVELSQVSSTLVRGRVVDVQPARGEPECRLLLVQAIPKGSGMTEVCERTSELGVASIWPVFSERTVPRPGPEASVERHRRWNKVAGEAAQLAGRSRAPVVQEPEGLGAALERLLVREPDAQLFVCHQEGTAVALTAAPYERSRPAAVLIGPEGGWSPGELGRLRFLGATVVSLGPRNLRTVVAGVVAVTLLLSRAGELGPPLGALA